MATIVLWAVNCTFMYAGAASGPGCTGLRFALVLRTRPGHDARRHQQLQRYSRHLPRPALPIPSALLLIQ
jgi:hypothetical protein